MSRATKIEDLPGPQPEPTSIPETENTVPSQITATVRKVVPSEVEAPFGEMSLEETALLLVLFATASSNVLDQHLTNIPFISGYLTSNVLRSLWKGVLFVIAFRMLTTHVLKKI